MKRRYTKTLLTVLALALICPCLFAFAACDAKKTVAPYTPETFSKTRIYELDTEHTNLMGQTMAPLMMNLLLDKQESYFEFGKDGKVRGQLKTIPLSVNSLFDALSRFGNDISRESVSAQLRNLDIAQTLQEDVEPLLPGFTERLSDGDVEGAFKLLQNTTGLHFKGLDFSEGPLKDGGKSMRLPANLLDLIPDNTQLSLTIDWEYNLVHLTGNDGTPYDAVYIGGETAHSAYTQPFAIFTMYTESDGTETMYMRIEFVNVDIALKLRETK